MNRLLIIIVLFGGIEVGWTFDLSNMTADELLIHANAAFSSGQFSQAADAYSQFSRDYENAAEARDAINRIRYPHSWSLIQSGRHAEACEAIERCLVSSYALSLAQREELMFWKGVCELQDHRPEEARISLEAFLSNFPLSKKKGEVLLLIGATFLVQSQYEDAANRFAEAADQLTGTLRYRAMVRELMSRIQADQIDESIDLLRRESANLESIPELMTFQMLMMELGSKCLEQGKLRGAIFCFQRIWLSNRLKQWQRNQVQDAQAKLSRLERRTGADPYQKYVLSRMVSDSQRELAHFQGITDFDRQVRLRQAQAYRSMRRFREAAMVLEEWLRLFPLEKEAEQCALTLVQCWMESEQWDKAIQVAQSFIQRFPRSLQQAQMLYLKGLTHQKLDEFDSAIESFEKIRSQYPKSDFAVRALFFKGFTELLNDLPDKAIRTFEQFQQYHPQHELQDAAAYWRGMAYSFDKQWDRCREVMDDYLKHFPEGVYYASAIFRKAYAAHSKRDFQTSIKENRAYLTSYPGFAENAEACILLGDALMNEGEIEEGIFAYARIPTDEIRFYEEGVFKTVKALRLLEKFDLAIKKLETFQREFPRSARIVEAIFHIGKIHKDRGEWDKARGVYWDAIQRLGNDASLRTIEELFPAVAKLYSGVEEQEIYLNKLSELRQAAERSGDRIMAFRSLWAQGLALKRRNPERSRELFLEAARQVDVQTAHPLVLADLADAKMASGDQEEGAELYRQLLRWNPRAIQKDRALFALATHAQSKKQTSEALSYLHRLLEEVPESMLLGSVLLLKANLELENASYVVARQTLDALLSSPYVSGRYKAEALYQMAELWMRDGQPDKAFAYFQRIYVLYERWSDWVAKAYLRSAQILEARHDLEAAKRTYEEMTQRTELAEFAETKEAYRRLEALSAG